MSFLNVIEEKISSLRSLDKNLKDSLGDGTFHMEKVAQQINLTIPEIQQLDVSAEEMKAETLSILQQVPSLVGSVWNSTIKEINAVGSEIARWNEIRQLYQEWTAKEEEKALKNEELKQKITNSELAEPTKVSSMRRAPGTKPEISLGKYRRLQSQLEGGEDSEG
tara:strand:+ start:182 stop:676 length:495 start_codon:yes stop_codon:yes gene_type:complete